MSVVVSDLVAKVRAEGVEQTTAAVKQTTAAAQEAARALQIMAEHAAKSAPTQGSAAQILELFQKGNVQPTAAAMAQAATEMQKTAAAASQAVQPTQNVARAATEHAAAARSGAQAAQQVAEGWKVSESNIARFGAGLLGVSLGISLVAGAARLIHQAISDVIEAQVQWEQSIVRTSMLYGALAPSIVTMSQAQSQAPGLLGSQQEFLTANLNAAYLSTRFGVPQADVFGLTSAVGRVSNVLSLDAQGRADLQGRALAFAEGGGSSLRPYGIEGDPLSIARSIGGVSGGQLQALTPGQLRDVQTQIATAGLARDAILGSANQPGLLQAQNQREKALTEAQGNLQNALENLRSTGGGGVAGRSELALATNFPLLGAAGELQQRADLGLGPGTGNPAEPRADIPGLTQSVADAKAAYEAAARAVGDNITALAQASAAIEKAGVTYGSAAFRLLGFTGSLEDVTSIARGDIGAQAQTAVAARAVSAIPGIGTPDAEITYRATQTAYQQAYQNYVAQQAQQSQSNAIQDWLSLRAGQEDPGGPAQQAIRQAEQAQPIQQQMGEAQKAQSQIDLAAAERQAELDKISLDQRDRYVQLMRDTVELRLQDNSLQQQAIRASEDLIRAQQAALPSQYRASDAQYQQDLAQAIAQQRMGRLLQGQSVSDLPSLDDLINMRYQGQLAGAENAPDVVRAQHAVDVAGRPVAQVSLDQALTESNIRLAELANDAKNLADIPRQTAYELELNQLSRDSISVQTEMREYLKALVWIMTNQPTGGSGLGGLGGGSSAPLSPPDLPGNRRGPS